MSKYSLAQSLIGSHWLTSGAIAHADGSISKGFEVEPHSSGILEEEFEGPNSESFFSKLSDLLSKLPDLFEGQILLNRSALTDVEVPGFRTKLLCFEKTKSPDSYSHLEAVFTELTFNPTPLSEPSWRCLVSGLVGSDANSNRVPDLTWEKDHIRSSDKVIRALSLTELPQLTWKGALQSIFESPCDFTLSIRLSIPSRQKTRKQLETKRRVSHALSVTSSLEVRNIESNSVLHSSEETLERILVGKETLFEASIAVFLLGNATETLKLSKNFERLVAGVGNAGLYTESLGCLPVLKSHIPGNRTLGIRKLPILSENLAHVLPIFHDYSRKSDPSSLSLRSRTGEVSHLNLFSKENLNFNAFICGASGSGKSFLMNALCSAFLKDEPNSRLCIFDVGGSYRKIISANGGQTATLSPNEATALISSFLRLYPTDGTGFYRNFVKTLCGSGTHVSHSHWVAIDDLLKHSAGKTLRIREIIKAASNRSENFYQDIAHWLKPHVSLDDVSERTELFDLIQSPVSSFDFKELSSDPVLQRTTVLLLSEFLWRDLMEGRYSRTLVAFDEVWRFFAQNKDSPEEMYRTFRKYRAGIVSITQNLADYGDDGFAKMLFTTSFTKIFLQNGASGTFLKETLDLPQSDIDRALSVASKKREYSEFFVLTPSMSQILRLYPTAQLYDLANTENITETSRKERA